MKKFPLVTACFFLLVQLAGAHGLHGMRVTAGSPATGITVAGGNGSGPAAYQFNYPEGVAVDAAGNIYIADYYNHRIQKWAPGATSGVTVAGGNGTGSAANQVNDPNDVFVDAAGNIYISDDYITDRVNYRVQKWAPGASSGVTVAGGVGFGSAANQLSSPQGVFVDASGNLYIADYFNNRIQKWAPGATSGITVAGGNGSGSAPDQMADITDVFVDANGNIYVADGGNNRIQKFFANGLSFKYYEGDWNVLPDFNALTPVKSGTSANIDISVRPAGVQEHYGFLWQGYLNIKTPGTYNFTTVSDDGSKLYFNTPYSAAATPLVNNDGLHGFVPASGSVNIASAGIYPIAITYFNKTGVTGISVYWSGPGFSQQPIPDAVFVAAGSDNIAPGTPVNLHAVSAGGTFVNLDWDDATDNVGVTGYDVYVNGVRQYTTPTSAVTAGNLSPNTTYSFTVVAFDLAGNRSAPSAPLSAATTAAVSSGLSYRVYQGDWNVLPDFSALTPVKTGISPNIDLSVRPAGLEEHFGFLWQGYINITTPGSYTFSTASDDGSRFYFNTMYAPGAIPLVNNDGLHGYTPASGTLNIPAAGLFPIAITYFNKLGGKGISVYWSGPGFSQQLIPDAVLIAAATDTLAPSTPVNLTAVSAGRSFVNLDWNDAADNVGVAGYEVYVNGAKQYTTTSSAVAATGLMASTSYNFTVVAFDQTGNRSAASAVLTASTAATDPAGALSYRVYQGDWNVLPDFGVLTPVKAGNSANIDLGIRPSGVDENFGIVWQGYINISTPGSYTFSTVSDDGSRLYFNTAYSAAATPLVNNDGLHGYVTASGMVNIPAPGVYPIAITYFNKTGSKGISVYWSGPGFGQQLIPNAAFVPAPPPFVMASNGTESGVVGHTAITEQLKSKTEITHIYPVPFTNRLQIDFYNSAPANDIRICISDVYGRTVYAHHPATFAAGNQTLVLPLSGTGMPDGVYLLTLQVNGIAVKTVPLVKAMQ